MNLTINLVYNIPKRKTYYRPISPIGTYELEDNKRYCFHYFNKFGSGIVWKGSEFIAKLRPSDKIIQLLFGLK
jgi:hypothetical protein